MKQPMKRMVYRDGHLVSIGFKKGSDVRRSLTLPYLAIWVGASLQTPGVRRTLYDKDGSVTALMQDIADFRFCTCIVKQSNCCGTYLYRLIAR